MMIRMIASFLKRHWKTFPITSTLTIVNDGVQLIDFLKANTHNLPDVLFLDLNMPRKSGFECLSEIKRLDSLKHVPVIIFSTSLDMEVAHLLYNKGAHHYIRKPGEYIILKKIILKVLTLGIENNFKLPPKDHFILDI